jgi:hypothetical protein
MYWLKLARLMLALSICAMGQAAAQTTTGTIRGHVSDNQDLGVPGVTVTATSPNLQGQRVAVTTENGDYVLTGLPSGVYTLSFELSGFETVQRQITVAPTQDVPVNVQMGLASVTESVTVVGHAADVLTQTAQVATNIRVSIWDG